MRTLIKLAISAATCWLLVEAALTVRALRRLPDDVLAEIAATREAAMVEIAAAREAALHEVSATREDLTAQLAATRIDLRREIHAAIERADSRLGEITALTGDASAVLAEARGAVAEIRGLVSESRAAQAGFIRRIDYWTDCQVNGYCWQGVLTDTMLAARQAALEVRRSAPAIVQSVEASARSVELTAQASARTAEQIAIITRPAPRWVRWLGVGLGVAAPAAQVAIAAGAARR